MRQTDYIENIEAIHQIAEIELIYHNPVKPADRPKIRDANETYHILMATWNMNSIELQEEFKVILLDRAGSILGILNLSKGGIHATIADPKLIFAAALKAAACQIILAHNHPSGTLKPSKHDLEMTQKLKAGAAFLDINLLDHLIITPDGYFSFANEGLL